MGLNKAKKVYVWCSSVAIPLHIGRSGLKNGNKIDKHQYPSRVPCPKCGQRFKIRWTDCEDWGGRAGRYEKGIRGCWHGSLPPHKKVVKLVRGKNLKRIR